MTNRSELISPVFRVNFREFCVSYLVLRQIDDAFKSSGIHKGSLEPDNYFSGQRRTLVEEYYSSLDWTKQSDANKFINAVQFTYAQSYRGNEGPRIQLRNILDQEGYTIEGWKIVRPSGSKSEEVVSDVDPEALRQLANKLIELENLQPIPRGFAFERLLNEMFALFNLKPRGSFRLVGEQIDGSFQVGSDTYLLEARWRSKQADQRDLLVFKEQVEGKSTWTRGLFVSYAGFSSDGLTAFSRGRATNIIGMDGQDLFFVLKGEISLPDAILGKVRRAAETGEIFFPVYYLIH